MAVTLIRREDTPAPDSGLAARLAIRAHKHRGPTHGLAPGYVQGNLAILPQALAADFLRFCQLNPKPCPLIGMSAPGDWRVPTLGGTRNQRRRSLKRRAPYAARGFSTSVHLAGNP